MDMDSKNFFLPDPRLSAGLFNDGAAPVDDALIDSLLQGYMTQINHGSLTQQLLAQPLSPAQANQLNVAAQFGALANLSRHMPAQPTLLTPSLATQSYLGPSSYAGAMLTSPLQSIGQSSAAEGVSSLERTRSDSVDFEGDDDDIEREAKRYSHILSEKKRRDKVRDGFTLLRQSLPSNKRAANRAVLLQMGADRIRHLERDNVNLRKRLEELESLVAKGKVTAKDAVAADGSPKPDVYEQLISQLQSELVIVGANIGRTEIRMAHTEPNGQTSNIASREELENLYRQHSGEEEVRISIYVRVPDEYRKGGAALLSSTNAQPGSSLRRVQVGDGVAADEVEDIHQQMHIHMLSNDDDLPELMDLDKDNEPELLDQLLQKLHDNPLASTGGPRYKDPSWQRARARRVLRACDLDVTLAYEFLCDHFEWCELVKPWLFTREMVLPELKTNKMYWFKTDLKGNPIIVFRTKRHIVRPEQENHESVRAFLYLVEQFIQHLAQSPYQKFSVIYDRRDTTLANADVWLLKKLLKILQVNCVEQVHKIYVINPDYGFLYGYSILTRFLTRRFRARIKFLDLEMWKEQLAGECGAENLEVDMGGLCETKYDQDGIIMT